MLTEWVAGSKKGEGIEPVARKPAVLMTQKFALPRPAQFRIDEAAGQSGPGACTKRRRVS